MNKENNDTEFKDSINQNSNYKSQNHQNKRELLKKRLMDKYGLSSNKANEILLQIEKKSKMNDYSKKTQSKERDVEFVNLNSKQILNRRITDEGVNSGENAVVKNNVDIINKSVVNEYNEDESNPRFSLKLNKNDFNSRFNQNFIQKINNDDMKQNSHNPRDMLKESNVDGIMEEIIPDYNQQISINVSHVDLTFEVSHDKIDTLKENFIRTIKGNKSKKIRIHALKDISFQIYKGEKVGIIGFNGAGKSTLLNVITGIYAPDKGSVTTYGKISPLLSLGAGFDLNFSGRRNIILNGAVLGYDKEFLESKIDEIIEFSELGDFIDIPIKNYSSGMLAKLGFSIATAVNPDILIIDEILGVGDVNFARKSADKIRSLMDGGTTVLLVSHSIPQIRELCDKAIWIDEGAVKAIGEVNKVCDEYLKDAEKASNEQLANIELVK